MSQNLPDRIVDAASNGNLDVLNSLRAQGATLEDVRARYGEAFIFAAEHGHLPVLQWLYDWGITITTDQETYGNAFSSAAGEGRLLILEWLLGRGVTLAAHPDAYSDAFMDAAAEGHTDIMQWIRDQGFTLDDARRVNETLGDVAFVTAAERGHLGVLQWLRTWGFTLEDAEIDYNEAYRRADENGHTNITAWLEEWGFVPPDQDMDLDEEDDANALLDQGIDPTDPQRRPLPPAPVGIPRDEWSLYNSLQLRRAVKKGDIDSLRRMQGITLEDIRMRENTMLISAVSNEHISVIQFLGQKGLTVDDARTRNNACLKMAVTNGNVKVIDALKGLGLKYRDLMVGNPSALDIANDDGNPVVLKALRDWNEEENPTNVCEGVTQTCGICQYDLLDVRSDRTVAAVSFLITPCKHIFHEDELRQWIGSGKATCPIDRQPITNGLLQLDIPEGATFAAACDEIQATLRR